jgi:hypothetical protein
MIESAGSRVELEIARFVSWHTYQSLMGPLFLWSASRTHAITGHHFAAQSACDLSDEQAFFILAAGSTVS